MARSVLPANGAVYDRVRLALVDLEDGIWTTPMHPELGATSREVAVRVSGDRAHGQYQDDPATGRLTGSDLGQRCYRILERMVREGEATRFGSGPVRYRGTARLMRANAATLDEMPPLSVTAERNAGEVQ